MYLPILPDKVPYILKEQRGQEDALVWMYEPLTPHQRAKLFGGLRDDAEEPGVDMLVEVIRMALIDVVGLDIGGDTYDRENPAHQRTLWGFRMAWMTEVAGEIISLSSLTKEQQGN